MSATLISVSSLPSSITSVVGNFCCCVGPCCCWCSSGTVSFSCFDFLASLGLLLDVMVELKKKKTHYMKGGGETGSMYMQS